MLTLHKTNLLQGFLALSLCTIFISCDSEDIAEGGTAWRLNLGNSWVFRIQGFDQTGSTTFDYEDSVFLSLDTIIGSEKWYINTVGASRTFYTNRSDGLWVFSSVPPYDQPMLAQKYPAKVGDKYSSTPGTEATVQSINEQVSVPAGNFKCVKLKITYSDRYQYVYFMPNMGMVKVSVYRYDPDGNEFLSFEQRLIRYTLF